MPRTLIQVRGILRFGGNFSSSITNVRGLFMKQLQLKAARRLVQLAKEDASEWWTALPSDQKKQYIENHPNSKYAKDAIKEDEAKDEPKSEDEQPAPKVSKEATEKQVKSAVSTLRSNGSKIANKLKSTFPRMHHASTGLKNLATGKPLDDEHKEALVELGMMALNTGLSKSFGVWHAVTISQVGYTAVKHAMDHYKEKKAANKDKDDVEVFVEAVADSLEQKPEPVSKDEFKMFYKGTISSAIKTHTKHIVQILDKSFSDVKPAVKGLQSLRKGEKMDPEHRKAIIRLGKFAIGAAITYIPGGALAHAGASVGMVVINRAVSAVRKSAVSGESILNEFVGAIADSLEDSVLDFAAESGGME